MNDLIGFVNLDWGTEGTKCGVMAIAKEDNVTVNLCEDKSYSKTKKKSTKELKVEEKACIDQNNTANIKLIEENKVDITFTPCK
jgi:hypothetical protein